MFLIFGLLSLVTPVLGILFIVWAIITVWRAVALPRSSPRVPHCVRCLYPVADLATFICPECGADLRTVGIVTPAVQARLRGSLFTALVAWTFLFGAGSYLALIVGYMFVGFGAAMSAATTSNTWSNTLTPHSGNYQSVELVYDTDWSSVTSHIEITLVATDRSIQSIKVEPGTMQVSGLEDAPVAWDADTIETWYATLGLDVTDPTIAAEAAEVARVVDLTNMSPTSATALPNLRRHASIATPIGIMNAAPTFTPFGPGSGVVMLTVLAVAAVIYLLGIVFIVSRRRRLFRIVDNSPPSL